LRKDGNKNEYRTKNGTKASTESVFDFIKVSLTWSSNAMIGSHSFLRASYFTINLSLRDRPMFDFTVGHAHDFAAPFPHTTDCLVAVLVSWRSTTSNLTGFVKRGPSYTREDHDCLRLTLYNVINNICDVFNHSRLLTLHYWLNLHHELALHHWLAILHHHAGLNLRNPWLLLHHHLILLINGRHA
jgi:hypothetical protein